MDNVTLSTGVVLSIKPVPLMVIDAVRTNMAKTRPKVPIVHIEQDDRDEANANDPDYIEAMRAWDSQMTNIIYDTMITQGTVAATMPDGFPKVDDDDWADDLSVLKIEVPKEGKGWHKARYLAWVKYVAAVGNDDIQKILEACQKAAGLSEVDVAKATENFQRQTERPAN